MRTPPTHRVRYAYATYGTCALIHAHTRFRRSQPISTVCVRHFSSVWVCRPTARIKTRGWRQSDADCRFLLFCSNRGQRVNPRFSVTVALVSFSASFEFLCYGSTAIINILLFHCGDRLQTSEADIP